MQQFRLADEGSDPQEGLRDHLLPLLSLLLRERWLVRGAGGVPVPGRLCGREVRDPRVMDRPTSVAKWTSALREFALEGKGEGKKEEEGGRGRKREGEGERERNGGVGEGEGGERNRGKGMRKRQTDTRKSSV